VEWGVLMEIEKLMTETAEHYEGKMDKLFHTIQELKQRCSNLQRDNKALKKQNAALIKQKKQKQHYKNGVRGTKLNG
jgi:hypothetical protein